MNLTFTGLLYGAAAACLAVSFRKDREKTNQAVKKGFRMFLGVLPHFLTILLITGILFTAVTPGMIRDVIGTGSGFRGITKFKELKKLGVEEERAWICANMRNGNWFCSGYITLQGAFNNKKLRELGYPTFTEFYLKICEN